MSKNSKDKPQKKSSDSREDRLKAALKSNMAKRKAQARQRLHGQTQDTADQEAADNNQG